MHRPIILSQRINVPVAVLDASGNTIPGQAVSMRENFQAPEKMKIDYVLFNLEGIAVGSPICEISNMYAEVIDKNRRSWLYEPIPLENFNNCIRQRIERNIIGLRHEQTIDASGNWTPPAGKYLLFADSSNLQVQINTGTVGVPSWVGTAEASGIYTFDGTERFRIHNADGTNSHKLYYMNINQFEAGEFWLKRPFRLQKTHSISLDIRNRMNVTTEFHLSFQAVGEVSNRIYMLEQFVSVPAGSSRIFSGIGMNVTAEEPILIKSMQYSRIENMQAFDPRFVDVIIKCSQGGDWMNDYVPLITLSNVRGQYVNAIFEPLVEQILDFNDYLIFKLYNYDLNSAKTCLVSIVGGSVE